MADTISIIIHTFNESRMIADCIKSAQSLSKDITVYDSQSTDNTVRIAVKHGARVYKMAHFKYVEPARKLSIEKSLGDWVFILDADERISADLAREITQTIKKKQFSHFQIPRKNYFGRLKWLKYGGWYPDLVVRLIRRKDFVNWPKEIHSTPAVMGKRGTLKNPLTHYFHPSLENMVSKTAVYEDIESDLLYKAGKKANTLVFFRKFFGELGRRLLLRGGFRDGTYGVIESIYQAFSKTVTYIFLYEKYKKNRSV